MPETWSFLGGREGDWSVTGIAAVTGAGLPPAEALAIRQEGAADLPGSADLPGGAGLPDAAWRLRAFVSNIRYSRGDELAELKSRQHGLARPEATRAALIPIRKTAAWWDLPQDARREIFEETSHHTAIGLDYLPAVARRLHHCRDLGEPFDFLTWFEFAPADEPAFDHLVERLRATREWTYVEREVDVRLERRG